MYLMQLSCTLKNGQNDLFYVKYTITVFKGRITAQKLQSAKNRNNNPLQHKLFLVHTAFHYPRNLNIIGLSDSLKKKKN